MTGDLHRVDSRTLALPASLPQAARVELGRAFRPPYETLIVLAVNGLLMSGLWLWAPGSWKNSLFSLHGPLAFAMVLGGWMISDVPATNVLGSDARRMSEVLSDPEMFRRLLFAKNLALWIFVCPLCSAIALGIGLDNHDYLAMLIAILAMMIIPFGALGISAWVGVRFPYHPIPLSERWSHRRPWGYMVLRWLVLVTTPYWLVPTVIFAFITPTLLLWGISAQNGLTGRLSDGEFAWGVLLACGLSLVGAVVGLRVSERWARRRRVKLSAFLEDRSLG